MGNRHRNITFIAQLDECCLTTHQHNLDHSVSYTDHLEKPLYIYTYKQSLILIVMRQ